MTTNALKPGPSVQHVALNLLMPSPTNPRKTFDEKFISGLADSIKINGVVQPLLCRKTGGGAGPFEIVFGEQRYRAAKLAKAETVPIILRDLNDAEVREFQLIENLQRQDLEPLEEARAFRQLLEANPKMTVKEIGIRIGKSERYVSMRLRLLLLSKKHTALLEKKEYSLGIALQLARLEPSMQDQIPEHAFFGSEARLHEWIEDHVLLDLSRAQFDTKDAKLFPEAGACTNCPKRTGANATLFSDIKKGDLCTDAVCYETKQKRLVSIVVESNTKKGDKPPVQVSDRWTNDLPKGVLERDDYTVCSKDSCDNVEKAVVAHGDTVGKVLTICRSKDCKTHYGRSGVTYGENPRAKTQRLNRERAERIKREVRHRVFRKVVEAVTAKLGPTDLELVATSLLHKTQNDPCRKFVRIMGMDEPEKKGKGFDTHLSAKMKTFNERQLNQFIIGLALLHDADEPPQPDWGSKVKPPDPLEKLVKHYKIDSGKIEREYLAAKTKKPKAEMKKVVEASGRQRVKDAAKVKAAAAK